MTARRILLALTFLRRRIAAAMAWQKRTGIRTWVGAWTPGDDDKGDPYTIAEQVVFATFMTCELDRAGVPFAVNSDTKFHDRDTNTWVAARAPVLDAILKPRCGP